MSLLLNIESWYSRLASYINARGFELAVDGPWQARSIVSGEIVGFGWWMLDLARAIASNKFTSLLHHLQKCF